jgi:hypothetical protein
MIGLSTPPMSSVLSIIEQRLRELWRSEPGQAARSRVCTMNLIVVTGSSDVADHYVTVVDEVTRGTPARAILVSMDPGAAENLLDGDVTAVGGDVSTFSERVRLHASGGACARVGSAVEALLVPEIPTTLVWLGRVHVDDPLFIELAEYAERIVLDTDYTSLSSLLSLARWARADLRRPAIADLAWTRIAIWQELCARFFDDPQMREHASTISKLSIDQASDTGARLGSEGALLIGWLATRLGWKIERLGGALRFKRPDGGKIVLTLRAIQRREGVAPLALAGIRFESTHDGKLAKGEIVRELASGAAVHAATPDADVLKWKLDVDLPAATEQVVRMGANKGGRLLERVLHRPGPDAALADAVVVAEELNDDGVVCV